MRTLQTLETHLTICNEKGLHVRAATALAQTAGRYQSTVTIEHDGTRANAKSVMHLLLLTAAHGTTVSVRASGVDAREALDMITALIERGFGEEG